jgi:hypothetical protein
LPSFSPHEEAIRYKQRIDQLERCTLKIKYPSPPSVRHFFASFEEQNKGRALAYGKQMRGFRSIREIGV